jgi:hypothetical protein
MRAASLWIGVLLLALAGCDDNGGMPEGDAGMSEFDGIFADIVDQGSEADGCNRLGCHRGSAPSAGLNLETADVAFANLVGVPVSGAAACQPGEHGNRVTAGDPAASVLFSKVSEAEPVCGSRMPLGGDPLTQAEQDRIEAWILAGAAR